MSRISLIYVIALGFTLLMAGCSTFESTEGESSESSSSAMSGNADYDNMLTEVSAKFKELDKMGGAWAYSGDIIDNAAEAAKNKDFAKAVKLLKEADDEIAIAKAQFESQKNAGPHLF